VQSSEATTRQLKNSAKSNCEELGTGPRGADPFTKPAPSNPMISAPFYPMVTERFIESGALPKKATNDAAHVAIAAVSGMQYLLTWNCKHIANAQISRVILRVCEEFGYSAPLLCTPLEFIGGEHD
jgi:hypothetical protein